MPVKIISFLLLTMLALLLVDYFSSFDFFGVFEKYPAPAVFAVWLVFASLIVNLPYKNHND